MSFEDVPARTKISPSQSNSTLEYDSLTWTPYSGIHIQNIFIQVHIKNIAMLVPLYSDTFDPQKTGLLAKIN